MVSVSDKESLWERMRYLIDRYGFKPYPILSDDESEDADSIEESQTKNVGPLTAIQLVRHAVGLPLAMSDFPAYAFWKTHELRLVLDEAWSAIEAALTEYQPGSLSFVAWCDSSTGVNEDQLRQVLEIAAVLKPNLLAGEFEPRPTSPFVIKPKSVEAAIFNMLGAVRTTEGLPYGDLLGTLVSRRISNVELFDKIDMRLTALSASQIRPDRDTPIPALLCRNFFETSDGGLRELGGLTVVGYLQHLESQNNLSGLSDQALTLRLCGSLKRVGNETKPRLPVALQKLVDAQSKQI